MPALTQMEKREKHLGLHGYTRKQSQIAHHHIPQTLVMFHIYVQTHPMVIALFEDLN